MTDRIKDCGRIPEDAVCTPFSCRYLDWDEKTGTFVDNGKVLPPCVQVGNGETWVNPDGGVEEGHVEWALPDGWQATLMLEWRI